MKKKTLKKDGSFGRYGFVQNENGRIFLPPDQMSLCLIGDIIEFSIEENNGKQSATVEAIIKSTLDELIGRYVIKGKGHFVEAIDSKIQTRIYIPEPFRNDSKENDIVKIKITKHPFKSEGNTQAKITKILGNVHTSGVWHQTAIEQFNIQTPLSLNTQEQTKLIQQYDQIVQKRLSEQNFTHLNFFTIDAETSIDLDDAICVEKTPEGSELYIAIADPSVIIEPGHSIHKHCLTAATSTYLPGQTIPMLPAFLSDELFSLLPNQKRLALVLHFSLDKTYSLVNASLTPGIIESKTKFSYSQADELIQKNESLSTLKTITDALYNDRKRNEIIMEQSDDYHFALNDDLSLKSITKKELSTSRKMIEECMVYANKWVAEFLSKHHTGLFITQSGLRNNTIEQVNDLLSNTLNDYQASKISDPDYFKQCFNQLLNTDKLCIQKRLERSKISKTSEAHWAMGIKKYCTFTSPIRKANDLFVHQFIHNLLSNSNQPKLSDNDVSYISEQSRNARAASNQIENQLRIDSINVDQIFKAKIVHATSSSIIFKILDNGAQCQYLLKKQKSKFDPIRFSHQIKQMHYKLDDIFNIKICNKDAFSNKLECTIPTDE